MRWAGNRGWLVTIEQPVLDGHGRVDVALERGGWRVACEISISSSAEDELGNVKKCLAAGFDDVAVVYPSRTRLRNAAERIRSAIADEARDQVHFLTPEDLWSFLEEQEAKLAGGKRTVAGWAVQTRFRTVAPEEQERHVVGVAKALQRIWKGND